MRFSIISVAAAVCLVAGVQAAPAPQVPPTTPAAGGLGSVTGTIGGVIGPAGGATSNLGGGTAALSGVTSAANGVTGGTGGGTGGGAAGTPGRKRSEPESATTIPTETKPEGQSADAPTEAGPTDQTGQGANAGEKPQDKGPVGKVVETVKKLATDPQSGVDPNNVAGPVGGATQKTVGSISGTGGQTGLAGNAVSKLAQPASGI